MSFIWGRDDEPAGEPWPLSVTVTMIALVLTGVLIAWAWGLW